MKARRTALSLHIPRHGGPEGTSHSPGFDSLFYLPKRPERHETLEDFFSSDPPYPNLEQMRLTWVGGEFATWACPPELTFLPSMTELHEDRIRFYETAYSHNAAAPATRADANGNLLAQPIQLATAAVVLIAGTVAGLMALWWFLNR